METMSWLGPTRRHPRHNPATPTPILPERLVTVISAVGCRTGLNTRVGRYLGCSTEFRVTAETVAAHPRIVPVFTGFCPSLKAGLGLNAGDTAEVGYQSKWRSVMRVYPPDSTATAITC